MNKKLSIYEYVKEYISILLSNLIIFILTIATLKIILYAIDFMFAVETNTPLIRNLVIASEFGILTLFVTNVAIDIIRLSKHRAMINENQPQD